MAAGGTESGSIYRECRVLWIIFENDWYYSNLLTMMCQKLFYEFSLVWHWPISGSLYMGVKLLSRNWDTFG